MGMAGWTYCVTCTREPFLLGVYPMAGQRGRDESAVRARGLTVVGGACSVMPGSEVAISADGAAPST